MSESPQSWGRLPRTQQKVTPIYWPNENPFKKPYEGSVLPYGLGRSYGDSCLNDDGTLITTSSLDRFIEFNPDTNVLTCEAGVTFQSILNSFVPRGYFLPVTPGTKYVTLGGAIANDVHGKNHHRQGTLGCHILEFLLLRSNGDRIECSSSKNPDLFAATIGGLGLTGLILTAKIKLRKVAGPFIEMESIKFRNLDEFFKISEASDRCSEYTVAWIDCLSRGASLGRGIFMRGEHSSVQGSPADFKEKRKLSVPIDFPSFALNNLSVKAFNFLYYNKQQSPHRSTRTHYDPFFYPLDSIDSWNRIYGKRGFFQFQCVVPTKDAIREILQAISSSGKGSFLAVLKQFGDIKSPGLMSFPRQGYTLALDFSNDGEKTRNLLNYIESITTASNGAIYPAKDALMSCDSFKRYYPRWEQFSKFIDPKFSSSFWRRVMNQKIGTI